MLYAGRVINNRTSSSSKRSRSSRLTGQSGYTIVEVAIASFVMMFGLCSSILALQSGFRQVDLARGTTLAAQILQSEIERIRLYNWTAVNALPASETINLSENFSANPALVSKFVVTRTTSPDADRPTEVKNINVSVTWTTFDGLSHKRSLNSIYSKNGLYDYYYSIAHP